MKIAKFIMIFAVSFGIFYGTGELTYKIFDSAPVSWVAALSVGISVLFLLYKLVIVKDTSSSLEMISDTVSAVKNASDSISSRIAEKDSPFYALAEYEVKDGKVDQGLWSKALVIANGDENKRKIEYIKLRAMQLKRSS